MAELAVLDERAVRILDAAAELLLRWGYRKITVEDIAREAGVGKGTVYLHWKTKPDVFYSAFMREGLEWARALLARMREDVDCVLPGPMTAAMFLLVMERPISRAMFTGNTDMLGDLIDPTSSRPAQIASASASYGRYLELLRDNGFIRTDLTTEELFYLIDASSLGFYFIQDPSPLVTNLSLPARAKMLADAVDRAIAPARKPDRRRLPRLQGAALEVFQQMEDQMFEVLAKSQVS
ncbi:TetR family transcriptional regulator [Fodinicola feengrottensis]|uniref:TetR family transcriptional regulator n=1 Tax=Fodinicola feengrottensis TaxID=435914 RepID=UPI0013D366A2|nr:TetR/AcrR family transcriptional regulator [Fodinicola feengrottensis]